MRTFFLKFYRSKNDCKWKWRLGSIHISSKWYDSISSFDRSDDRSCKCKLTNIEFVIHIYTHKMRIHCKGSFFTEVRQIFSPWVSQVIRLYDNSSYVEFEWTIGPIPKEQRCVRLIVCLTYIHYLQTIFHSDPETKEIITRYSTDIASNGYFYTDANGRQMMRRL